MVRLAIVWASYPIAERVLAVIYVSVYPRTILQFFVIMMCELVEAALADLVSRVPDEIRAPMRVHGPVPASGKPIGPHARDTTSPLSFISFRPRTSGCKDTSRTRP